MKAKHARQIRKGIRAARNISWFEEAQHKSLLYQQFVKGATLLEWHAYDQYRQRHWTD